MKQFPVIFLLLLCSQIQAQTGFISSNIRMVKDSVIGEKPQRDLEQSGWRGEKLHTQVLITATRDLSHVGITAGPLLSKKGGTIPAENIQVGFLGYVQADAYFKGCGYRTPGDLDSSMVADIIGSGKPVAMKNGEQRSAWVSVKIPADAAPGLYTGNIIIEAEKKVKLTYRLRVSAQVLPPASSWSFDLDLWQHPAAIARVHGLKLWSEEHFAAMRPYYEMLAAAGQKNITASIVHEPWGHQTYDDFPSLIRWIKQKDGEWRFDYSLFDRYIEFVMSCGINKRINCYSMVPWKMMITYYDERVGGNITGPTPMGSDRYKDIWLPMLKDFTRHLKLKGWFDKTTIAMDERPMNDMKTAIAMLKGIDPAWKIALAGDYHPEIQKDIFDYCLASRWQFDKAELQERKAAGMPSTVYTCCVEQYPNGFTFSPPAENAWLGWYAMAKGFTGYLRWAYNSWPANPLQDSRYTAWESGDTYQVYPGPLSSIRFEKLAEGIQDYEKIRLLRRQWEAEKNQEKLAALDKILEKFEITALEKTSAEQLLVEAKAELQKLQN